MTKQPNGNPYQGSGSRVTQASKAKALKNVRKTLRCAQYGLKVGLSLRWRGIGPGPQAGKKLQNTGWGSCSKGGLQTAAGERGALHVRGLKTLKKPAA